jgi:hypothetical protein
VSDAKKLVSRAPDAAAEVVATVGAAIAAAATAATPAKKTPAKRPAAPRKTTAAKPASTAPDASWTVAALRDRARTAGIAGYSRMTKATLLDRLTK